MKKILLALFFTLLSTQIFAQKEAQEFPWSRAAKIVGADEAKASARKKVKRLPDTGKEKPEKKADTNDKKSK
jgi:hypothetical protein